MIDGSVPRQEPASGPPITKTSIDWRSIEHFIWSTDVSRIKEYSPPQPCARNRADSISFAINRGSWPSHWRAAANLVVGRQERPRVTSSGTAQPRINCISSARGGIGVVSETDINVLMTRSGCNARIRVSIPSSIELAQTALVVICRSFPATEPRSASR